MHAALITAYKDFPMLRRLVTRLDRAFFKPFVHVDKRSAIGPPELAELESLGCVVSKRYTVRWGSFTHLEAILHLMRQALAAGGFDYVHITSGQDYPLRTAEEFESQCDGRIFIQCKPLEQADAYSRQFYELHDPFAPMLGGPPGVGTLYRALDRPSRALQRWLGVRRQRFGPYAQLYKGIVWSSFPASAAERILTDKMAAQFLGSLRTTIVAEEVFFPTYFMHTDFHRLVADDDRRYTDWTRRNGAPPPAFLDESDEAAVLSSTALFARKMDSARSRALLDRIDAIRFG